MTDNNPEIEESNRLFKIAAAEMRSIRVSEDEVRAGLNRIHARMAGDSLSQRKETIKPKTDSTRFPRRISVFSTGVISAVLLLAVGFFSLSDGFKERGINTDPPSELLTYSTGMGERAVVTLADGSSVWLNAGSELKVGSDFSSGHRTVSLSGEAMFTVVPKSNSPFVVSTQEASVRVLGTTFVVRNYETDTATVVAVQDGKVAVMSSVLSANQEITISERFISSVTQANADRFSFSSGVLRISGTDFGNAIKDLNRWYNIQIVLADSSLASRRISGGFKAGSIDALEEILALMLDVRIIRDGHRLTLYPR